MCYHDITVVFVLAGQYHQFSLYRDNLNKWKPLLQCDECAKVVTQ